MFRERPGRRTGAVRSAARPRPGIVLAGALALAASTSGCLCVPSPSGVVGWPPTDPAGGRGRTRIAGAVHADHTLSDAAVSRTSLAQPPAAPGPGTGPGPTTPPAVPAIPQPPRPAGPRPLGAATEEASTAPASDIRTSALPPKPEYPIDLATALRLAERDNPLIGAVRARIGEALGNQQRARVELLPSLNAGADYDGHAGDLQTSSGRILNLSRQSVYFGGGAGTQAQNTITVPAVFINEPLTDALFDPLAAHQLVHVAEAEAAATTNAVLLEVTRYYLDLLGASARLEADRRGVVEAEELMRIAERYARTGEGRVSDFHRAQTEWRIRRGEARRDEEDVAVASARLCRRLHLDPSVQIRPISNSLEILALVDLDIEPERLIATAIEHRPEVKASIANLAASQIRLREEVARPFLPSLFLGFSGGGFGGGSNRNQPLVGNFAGRTDFDVAAYWTLLNGGLGNLLRQKQNRALVGEATGRRARTIALVREEVASALGDARARREQVEVARERLTTAVDGFRRDMERALQADPNKPGNTPRPIETINSLKLLIEARRMLVRTIVDYDQAQFQLFVALGSPPPLEHPTDPQHPAVAIRSLAAPVTNIPAELRPSGMGGGAGTDAPAAPGLPGAAQRDEPGPADGRALADAESDLARTLERLGAGGAGAGPQFAELAKAHQKSMDALLEYDRLQAELFRSLGGGAGASNPSDQVDRLLKLAEAHRKLMKSKVEYDETLWGLVRTLGTRAPDAAPAPALPPSAALTRGGADDATTGAR